jgi:hypothetical protein
MNEPQPVEPSLTNSDKASGAETNLKKNEDTSATDKANLIKPLSAEEQMALYEKELKENDWGHQPC